MKWNLLGAIIKLNYRDVWLSEKTLQSGNLSCMPWFQTHYTVLDKDFQPCYFSWKWWLYNLQCWISSLYVARLVTGNYLKFFLGLYGGGGGGGLITKSCLTLVTPWTVCSQTVSSVHGISQVRILEWAAISFYRGSSRPRDWTRALQAVSSPLSQQESTLRCLALPHLWWVLNNLYV